MKHKIPHLLRSRGAITRAASISRRQAVQNIVAYGASKAAVTHMTRAAAQQYGHATRVNAVSRDAIEAAIGQVDHPSRETASAMRPTLSD